MADFHVSGTPVGYGGQQAFHTNSSHAQEPQAAPKGAGMVTYANVAGAAVSLALLLGVGIWGYQLLVRDVSGVPVVRASSGPWRVAPENPGGEAADHQGLAVNEVAGRGTAAGPVDQVALAPQPVGLMEEDVPRKAPEITRTKPRSNDASAKLATLSEVAGTVPATAELLTDEGEDAAAAPIGDAKIAALVAQVSADATPLGALPEETELAAADEIAEPAPRVAGPGVRRSPRPRHRPAELIRASQIAAVTPVAASAPVAPEVKTLAVDDLAAGTRLVQLGAYESAAVAEQEWSRISGRFDSFFDGKARVIQKAKSGGRTFYRLRAHGFGDLAEARRFCAALVAERADCIPVVVK